MKTHRLLRTIALFAFFCLAPIGLLSCDSGGSNGGGSNGGGSNGGGSSTFSVEKGTFNLTVTEDGNETDFSGGAVFGVGSEASFSGNKAFVIYMLDGEKTLEEDGDVGGGWTELIIRERTDAVVPSTGEFSISRWDMNSQDLRTFVGTSGGTVQITSSSDSELEGTFSFSAFGTDVEGSFTAKKTDNANRVVCAPKCEGADNSNGS